MNKLNKIKVELLELAVRFYLWDGQQARRRGQHVHLCFALTAAADSLEHKHRSEYLNTADESICKDISEAIDNRAYASTYLIESCGWEVATPAADFQAWRRELAEKLITKYKGEEA